MASQSLLDYFAIQQLIHIVSHIPFVELSLFNVNCSDLYNATII